MYIADLHIHSQLFPGDKQGLYAGAPGFMGEEKRNSVW